MATSTPRPVSWIGTSLDDLRAMPAVYVVRFEDALYVLHAFQKKSHKGGRTPKRDKELIETRLAKVIADRKAGKRAG